MEKQPPVPAHVLYFVAIMLPAAMDEKIHRFKLEMASRFGSKKALRTASHITLKAPFNIPADETNKVIQWFDGLHIAVAPFVQELKDFGAFDNRRNPVIFVQPVMNASLAQLQQEVMQQFATTFPAQKTEGHEHPFSPHITIAYRDLQPHLFKEAWEVYQHKEYRDYFEVTAFQLLQHIGGRWQVVRHYDLKKDNQG